MDVKFRKELEISDVFCCSMLASRNHTGATQKTNFNDDISLVRINSSFISALLSVVIANRHQLLIAKKTEKQCIFSEPCFEFFSLVILLQQCVELFFCFLLSELDGDLLSVLIPLL